ncbi:unnamed protein product [Symbiodinium natans]|uniref:Uncharacterized protein n=1 Tax=Symbiodinium natans TaxID=878477 RepID=A0A812UU86_9DINO|nr:unnamed protein product [Symbiodinium natans]
MSRVFAFFFLVLVSLAGARHSRRSGCHGFSHFGHSGCQWKEKKENFFRLLGQARQHTHDLLTGIRHRVAEQQETVRQDVTAAWERARQSTQATMSEMREAVAEKQELKETLRRVRENTREKQAANERLTKENQRLEEEIRTMRQQSQEFQDAQKSFVQENQHLLEALRIAGLEKQELKETVRRLRERSREKQKTIDGLREQPEPSGSCPTEPQKVTTDELAMAQLQKLQGTMNRQEVYHYGHGYVHGLASSLSLCLLVFFSFHSRLCGQSPPVPSPRIEAEEPGAEAAAEAAADEAWDPLEPLEEEISDSGASASESESEESESERSEQSEEWEMVAGLD